MKKEDINQFKWQIDTFDDIKVLRYQVPEFENLTLNQKQYIFHLSQAALWGRDIFYDQNFKHNLEIRDILETIYLTKKDNGSCSEFCALEKYLKKVWFANGIHHHYSGDKFTPEFSRQYFEKSAKECGIKSERVEAIGEVIFNPSLYNQRCCQTEGCDLITSSAANYYENVSQGEAEEFYSEMAAKENSSQPVSYGLNSKLVKENGVLVEKVWKIGGLYSAGLEKIVENLYKAREFADNDSQREAITYLTEYYTTGNLEFFDKYNITWVKDSISMVDFVNGFIEVYGDPLGYKASWEANVNFKNLESTKRTEIISSNAAWFEKNSPIDEKYKKQEVKGVLAKVITVAMLGGDCFPATPIGINLPNADWIRKEHGSKSVTIQNITDAYSAAAVGDGFAEEFTLKAEDLELARLHGSLAGNLHTDLHECLGHGSGQLAVGVKGDELKNYGSVLEEARADLFALYYIADSKMVELGIISSLDVAKAEYNNYIFNGLMGQLTRVELGKDIVQAHMRDRQLIASWALENGKKDGVIEIVKRDEKSYVQINDYYKLRLLFGELLCEVQRIKSEGDYAAGKELVERYGVKPCVELHKEVLERYKALNLAPYSGFINPHYRIIKKNGVVEDVVVDYPSDFSAQMISYSQEYKIEGIN